MVFVYFCNITSWITKRFIVSETMQSELVDRTACLHNAHLRFGGWRNVPNRIIWRHPLRIRKCFCQNETAIITVQSVFREKYSVLLYFTWRILCFTSFSWRIFCFPPFFVINIQFYSIFHEEYSVLIALPWRIFCFTSSFMKNILF